ncbi:MAG: geranylgeranyl pyrophosphate synthase [Candidatus Peregrinibacteria bacterium Greene1014_49]|nr:MAG: geranylgeranyl pyrophosphate synthase [Candidatus Peregrinibacteria bacterium Greene1014_49]
MVFVLSLAVAGHSWKDHSPVGLPIAGVPEAWMIVRALYASASGLIWDLHIPIYYRNVMLNNPFEQFTQAHLPAIEHALDRYCPVDASSNAPLNEAMRYSLLLPGKRIRPLLVLFAADICGGSIEQAMPAACAVEMVHVFSLIHDDLPAMDDDDLRRGKPSNHKVYGEAQAILAGDALFARAFEVLASQIHPAATALSCIQELAEAAGPNGMAGGQSMDMQGLGDDAKIEMLDLLHRRKTGALIRCALRMGGIIANASQDRLAALTKYGEHVGLAFQITDDLLDVEGTAAKAGKTIGKDQAQGKCTYPALLGVEKSRKRAEMLIENAMKAISVFGKKAEALESLGESLLTRDH